MEESKSRVIQSEHLTIQLISGATIKIRPLTLYEREECFTFVPEGGIEEVADVGKMYIQVQGNLLHYIITRLNPEFKREDTDKLFDTGMVKKIFEFVFNDPFEGLNNG